MAGASWLLLNEAPSHQRRLEFLLCWLSSRIMAVSLRHVGTFVSPPVALPLCSALELTPPSDHARRAVFLGHDFLLPSHDDLGNPLPPQPCSRTAIDVNRNDGTVAELYAIGDPSCVPEANLPGIL